jgi:hypothetical protein
VPHVATAGRVSAVQGWLWWQAEPPQLAPGCPPPPPRPPPPGRHYHASLDAAEREDVQRKWTNNEIQVGGRAGRHGPYLALRPASRLHSCADRRRCRLSTSRNNHTSATELPAAAPARRSSWPPLRLVRGAQPLPLTLVCGPPPGGSRPALFCPSPPCSQPGT